MSVQLVLQQTRSMPLFVPPPLVSASLVSPFASDRVWHIFHAVCHSTVIAESSNERSMNSGLIFLLTPQSLPRDI
jgi:hypothetical protein